jgi:uncharacterized phage-like protein YoqJ
MYVICDGHKTCLKQCIAKKPYDLSTKDQKYHNFFNDPGFCWHNLHTDSNYHECSIVPIEYKQQSNFFPNDLSLNHTVSTERSNNMKNVSMCFSGHRKIAGDFISKQTNPELYAHMLNILTRAYTAGYRRFISGGAIGIDQLIAWAIIETKYYSDILLTIARPFPSQACKWPIHRQKELEEIINRADEVIDVNPDPYAAWKMQARNKWMIDNSRATVAFSDGSPKGGTANHIKTAIATSTTDVVLVINPITLTETWMKKNR